jgi:integrase
LIPNERSDEEPKRLRRLRGPHELRHGQASLMLSAGVDVKVISKRLGHSRTSFTADTYAHLLEGVQAKAAEAVAALVPRRRTARDQSGDQTPVTAEGSDSV